MSAGISISLTLWCAKCDAIVSPHFPDNLPRSTCDQPIWDCSLYALCLVNYKWINIKWFIATFWFNMTHEYLTNRWRCIFIVCKKVVKLGVPLFFDLNTGLSLAFENMRMSFNYVFAWRAFLIDTLILHLQSFTSREPAVINEFLNATSIIGGRCPDYGTVYVPPNATVPGTARLQLYFLIKYSRRSWDNDAFQRIVLWFLATTSLLIYKLTGFRGNSSYALRMPWHK